MLRKTAVLVALTVLLSPSAQARRHKQTGPVVDQVRIKLGLETLEGWRHGMAMRGSMEETGLPGTFTLTGVVTGDGRWVLAGEGATETVDACGFGQCWSRDLGGAPTLADPGAQEVMTLTAAVVWGLWTLPDAPFDVELVADKPGKGEVSLHLQVKGGRAGGTLYVDRATWFPVLFEPDDAWSPRIDLGSYEDVSGYQVAHAIGIGQGERVTRIKLTQAREARAEVDTEWHDDTALRARTTFDPAAGAEVGGRRLESGPLVVTAAVAGAAPGSWLVATGAERSVVTATLAEQAHLVPVGEGAGYWRATLQVGPLSAPEIVVAESSAPVVAGESLQGALGKDLFDRATVRIDLVDRGVEVLEPGAFTLDEGSWLGLVYRGGPCLPVQVEGTRTALFRLDTGLPRTTLHGPFVEEAGLLKGRKVEKAKETGVVTGPLASLQVAGRRFDDLAVVFATDHAGRFGDPYLAGTLGADVLQEFVIVLDFPNQRLALVPRKPTP